MKNTIALFLSLLIGGQILAQTENKNITTLSMVPQYILNNGIRIDIERQISKKSFLQIGPQFYLAENAMENPLNRNISYLIGGGCGIFHKIFLLEDFMQTGVYMSYGLTYNYFGVEFQVHSHDAESMAWGRINKIGADLIFGYQIFEYDRFIADLYAGLGTRYSFMNPGSVDDFFDDHFWNYNFTGNLLILGLRLGIIL